jgi:hypothetical protein
MPLVLERAFGNADKPSGLVLEEERALALRTRFTRSLGLALHLAPSPGDARRFIETKALRGIVWVKSL